MSAALRLSKLGRAFRAIGLAAALAGCRSATTSVPSTATADVLPRRVVLALDGVDFRDLETARARGLFRAFRPPGRLISTFPSISDIAWHAILGLQPPLGYQRVFYSLRQNDVLGDPLETLRPIEYERRMDAAFDTKFHHVGAYLISGPSSRREIDTDARVVLSTRGRETVYIYNVGPDALQHTRGDIGPYLAHLDSVLTTLLDVYRQRTGRTLDILVLSDHGNNRAADATFLPLTEALKARGFNTARSIRAPNDVVFSVDGVTTGFGVFCHPDSAERVAHLIANLAGVDVVTRRLSATRFDVQSTAGRALIRVQGQGASRRFAYEPSVGDPLALDSVLVRMRADGALDADGFADANGWLRYTAAHRYPAALPRIVHGHLAATRNPAPILVSLDDRHRVGLGLMSVTDRLLGLGGTHGALTATNSVGVVMSNTRDTPDLLALTAWQQLDGLLDLREPETPTTTMRLTTLSALRDDRFAEPRWRALPPTLPDSLPLLVLRLADARVPLSTDSLWFDVTVTRLRDGRLITATALPASRWWSGGDHREWAVRARDVRLDRLEPSERYRVTIRADGVRFRADGTPERWAQRLVRLDVRAAVDGIPWTY